MGVARVVVGVRNVNDVAPVLSHSAALECALNETTAPGLVLTRINATDPDQGPPVYELVQVSVEGVLDINPVTGVVVVNSQLDREAHALILAVIRVRDRGQPPLETNVSISLQVVDFNDNAPAFARREYVYNISEDTASDTLIDTILATDADSGLNAFITYELVPPPASSGLFSFTPFNARLVLEGQLDREQVAQHRLRLIARNLQGDDGITDPQRALQGETVVVINVLDVNDNPPQFPRNPYTVVFGEERNVGSVVVSLNATDRDVAVLTYSIVAGNALGHFRVDADGNIRNTAALDREALDHYELTVSVFDGDFTRTAVVDITVADFNDNVPQVALSAASTHVLEDVPVGTVLNVTVFATDRDQVNTSNSQLRASLRGANDCFGITPDLDIRTTCQLDHEAQRRFVLTVVISDLGEPALSNETELEMLVVDLNDNRPVFVNTSYRCELSEYATVSTECVVVQATDRDAEGSNNVTYTLVDSADGLFSINAQSGRVVLSGALDREGQDAYTLTVEARDSGVEKQLSSQVQVTVVVLDENDNAPVFGNSSYSCRVTEELQEASACVQLQATDADQAGSANARITYALAPGTDARFVLDAETGRLTTAAQAPFDRERQDQYVLTVVATDHGRPALNVSVELTVDIVDVNDHVPEFDQPAYACSLVEAAALGTTCVTVQAQDADAAAGAIITYSLMGNESLLAIDAATGHITLASDLDREVGGPQRLVTVRAVDSGNPPRATDVQVNVTVLDINDNSPVFDRQAYAMALSELQAVNTSILVVRATDVDAGLNGTVEYTVSGAGSGVVTVDRVSGELRLAMALDREQQDFYAFEVVATDLGSPSARATRAAVNISVLDANDNAPEIAQAAYTASLPENVAVGTVVVRVNASDADLGANATLSYTLVPPMADLTINATTGEVSVAQALDFERTTAYQLEVEVSDGGQPALRTRVPLNVTVEDLNDNAPVFSQAAYTCTVLENGQVGLLCLGAAVRATDRDAGLNAVVQYRLLSHTGLFVLDGTNGTLRTAVAFDREEQKEYTLLVQAYDLGTPEQATNTSLTVRIEDVNDHVPVVVALDNCTLPEDAAVGTNCTQLTALDRDGGDTLNGVVEYVLLTPAVPFGIDRETGLISVTGALDREQAASYELRVRVQDGGAPPSHVNVSVHVTVSDLNDETPTFGQAAYTCALSELAGAQALCVQVSATDRDEPGNANSRLSYTLIEPAGLEDTFAVDAQTGHVRLVRALDWESTPRYNLTVVVQDAGTPRRSSRVPLVVMVLDENDQAPTFGQPQYGCVLAENAAVGTFCVQPTASDLDDPTTNNSRFTFAVAEAALGWVQVDAASGQVRTARALDFETNRTLQLTLVVTDQGSPQPLHTRVPLVVTVTDVNDNDPEFIAPQFAATMLENVAAATDLVTVVASDADSGVRGQVQYALVAGNTRGLFTIDPDSGLVRTTGTALDREDQASHSLTVEARDGGSLPRRVTATVQVDVLDANDNVPAFSSPSGYNLTVAELTRNGSVLVARPSLHHSRTRELEHAAAHDRDTNNNRNSADYENTWL